LSKAEKTLCVRRDKTHYLLDVDNPETDCATLRLGDRGEDVGHGPFVPLAAVLYFQPEAARWYSDPILGGSWIGGKYYLNLRVPADVRMHFPTSKGGHRTHIVEALGTGDALAARRIARERQAHWALHFANLRRVGASELPSSMHKGQASR